MDAAAAIVITAGPFNKRISRTMCNSKLAVAVFHILRPLSTLCQTNIKACRRTLSTIRQRFRQTGESCPARSHNRNTL